MNELHRETVNPWRCVVSLCLHMPKEDDKQYLHLAKTVSALVLEELGIALKA